MGLNYTIIEDCSPYYIRFSHEGISDIIDVCLEESSKEIFKRKFTHHRFNPEVSQKILSLCPLTSELNLNPDRVSLFVTQPSFYYRAHKDGLNHRFSINYTIKILDNRCITSWYSDSDLKNYIIDNLASKTSRECDGFDKTKHTPLKSMTAVQGECILFNTDIFHDFDNTESSNERMILTLRDINPSKIYFEDIKRILFGL